MTFTGKERDAETGLDYFGARYYSGAQGRFTSPDEFPGGIVDPFTGQQVGQPGPLPYADITDPQTLNKYAYVRNNPLRFVDPDGHCIWDLCIGEGAAVYAVGAAAVGTAAYLMTPQGQQSVRGTVEGLGLLANTAVEGIGSIFNSTARPGTRGKPDHQDTADEEARKMGGGREVTIKTPEGAKGSRRADAAKTEGGEITDVVQVYRPTPGGNVPKREVDAARDIEKATGVKPRMVPVRPQNTPKPPKLPKELENH